ncbi:hypothetical protein ACVMAJ_004463 [Bradyrhizobium sp. USDA 4448]
MLSGETGTAETLERAHGDAGRTQSLRETRWQAAMA